MRGWAIIVLIVLALGAGGCAIFDRMSGLGQARELSKTGLPAEAAILRIWDTGVTVNDDPVVGFLLDVRPADQPAFQAETKICISRVLIPQYQPGAIVPVRFDPKDRRCVSLDIYEFH